MRNFNWGTIMKKHLAILSLLTLLAGGIALSTTSENVKTASADGETPTGHLFVQIEREEDLREGDKVFIATLGGTVFSALSGNPVFASESHVFGRSEDGKKYYTYYTESYQEMLLMQVEKGAYDNTWSFKSLRTKSQESNYAHPTRGRYLAYGHNYSDEKYQNIQAYGDVNFADGKGQYTSWTVEFRDEEKYAIIKRYGEEYDTHIQWVYYGRTARNNFGYYTGNTDICLFREVNVDQSSGRVSLDIFTHPDQTTVYQGDYLDLTGLEMRVTIDKNESTEFTFTSSYAIDHGFYTVSPAGEGNRVYCSYAGWNFNLEVEIIEDTSQYIYFNEIKAERGDYRGTYLVVYQSGTDVAQLRSDDTYAIEYEKDSADGAINSSMHSKIMIHRYYIVHHRISGVAYSFLYAANTNKYLIRNGNEYAFTSNANDLTAASAVTLDSNFNIHVGDGIMYFSNSDFHFGDNPSMDSRAKLYKRVVDFTEFNTENTQRYTTFVNHFAALSSEGCDVSGDTSTSLTTNDWNNTLATEFNNIIDDFNGYDFQGYLANMTYTHNAEKGTNSIKDLIDRYDYILTKYESIKGFDDFMDRKYSSAYQENYVAPETNNSIFAFSEEENQSMTMIVLVISAISTATLMALLIIKKKRK